MQAPLEGTIFILKTLVSKNRLVSKLDNNVNIATTNPHLTPLQNRPHGSSTHARGRPRESQHPKSCRQFYIVPQISNGAAPEYMEACTSWYVSGEHFSSHSVMSQEELLLVPFKTLSPFIFLFRHWLSKHLSGATTPIPSQKK
jgi:hypothetical protein